MPEPVFAEPLPESPPFPVEPSPSESDFKQALTEQAFAHLSIAELDALIARKVEQLRKTDPNDPEYRRKIRERFYVLTLTWRNERPNMSSFVKDYVGHPAYEEIIRMGWDVVPLILHELDHTLDFWFAALHRITGADPVPPASRGNLHEMACAWQVWGAEHGFYEP